MSEAEDRGIAQERAAAIKHLVNAAFPADHLAPWMSVHEKQKIVMLAALRNIGDVGKELDRRVDMTRNPEKYQADKDDKEFDITKIRGAAGMFAYCVNNFAAHVHDLAPSDGGLGRRQAVGGVIAQKAGIANASEPKKRSFFDKLTGKNKDKDQPSGG